MQEWTEIRRKVRVQGASKRSICKDYGVGWETLQKILANEEPPGYRQRAARPKTKPGHTAGSRRLVVRVEGDWRASWARSVPGVVVSEVESGAAHLVLDPSIDSDSVLRAAMSAGRVTEFVFRRRRLSEVFRDALG